MTKAYMSTPGDGRYHYNTAAWRRAAESEARAILAETEDIRVDNVVWTNPGTGESYTKDGAHSSRCQCLACLRERLAESLAAFVALEISE